MPIYEYRCKACRCEFEVLRFSSDDSEPRCPTCCGSDVKKLISSGNLRPQGIANGKGGFNPPKCRPSGG